MVNLDYAGRACRVIDKAVHAQTCCTQLQLLALKVHDWLEGAGSAHCRCRCYLLVSGRNKHATSKNICGNQCSLHDKSHSHYAPAATFTLTCKEGITCAHVLSHVKRALRVHMYSLMYTRHWTIVWYTRTHSRHAHNTRTALHPSSSC